MIIRIFGTGSLKRNDLPDSQWCSRSTVATLESISTPEQLAGRVHFAARRGAGFIRAVTLRWATIERR